MAKLNRETIVAEALDLLDEVGLDEITTRRLASRLGVEQPSLYWHFKKKEDLLAAMAEAAMQPHTGAQLPKPSDSWQHWFLDNHRSLRATLLMRRDGARLHAGSFPGGSDIERIMRKLAFLIAAGIPEYDAKVALFAASRYTVGSVLEEQAEVARKRSGEQPQFDQSEAFEGGLKLILDGLSSRYK
ncbi:TetR/AcrR family transcriptional regulator C-terminal domain-containing protein [Neorhizobium sp. NCHU2750]|uniref:TetR/AcrR family transcriptional regulator C-terminal domain-containing protein n=1 Tax=Neorhizobium sp. NCHU2750 TaxID=1825976 RepID=UPI000E7534CE|nr:TetR family transcriptional regulator [Neorhizobium sp. NCHU2750]